MSPETPAKLRRVYEHMAKHAETRIDMTAWGWEYFNPRDGCRTAMCVAGWAILTLEPSTFADGKWNTTLAEQLLGLSDGEAHYLFCSWDHWPLPWYDDMAREDQLAAVRSAMDVICDGSWNRPPYYTDPLHMGGEE